MPNIIRRLLCFVPILVASMLSVHLVAAAGPATLVKDIQDTFHDRYEKGASETYGINGNTAYYFVFDLYRGVELWKSDGTPAGTGILRNISPTIPANSDFVFTPFFTNVGDLTFFIANDGQHGTELWKTDGTAAGTTLVKDLVPGPAESRPYFLTAVGDHVFFLATTEGHLSQLWTSDGTATGTIPVKGAWPERYGDGYSLTNVDGTLFMFAFNFDPASDPHMMLLKSDGTTAGTVRVYEFDRSCSPTDSAGYMDHIFYFVACDKTSSGSFEVWRSDGTAQGTFPITNVPAAQAGSLTQGPIAFVPFKNALYFSIHNKIWRTTGVTETTTALFNQSADFLTASNDRLFFASNTSDKGKELWMSDGATTTTLVKDINPGSASSFPHRFVPTSTGVIFSADDGSHGREVWASDGTAQGTLLLHDIAAGHPSSVSDFRYREYNDIQTDDIDAISWGRLANGPMLFMAYGGVWSYQLWRTDGTAEGTVLVEAHDNPTNDTFLSKAIDLQGTLIVNASHDTTVSLWRSDGTAAGTAPISPTIRMTNTPIVMDSTLFFGYRNQLWRSNGTAATTTLVKNFSTSPWLDTLTPLEHALFFRANDGLWRSDGTSAGTTLVVPVAPIDLVALNGALYFNTVTYTQGVPQWTLWRSDGTTTGTAAISQHAAAPQGFVAFKDRVFFSVVTKDAALWETDGTDQGTRRVISLPRDENADQNDSLSPQAIGERLFFTFADAEHGDELWTSDGTAAGTHLVRDIEAGPASAAPQHLVAFNDSVYFSAFSAQSGRELWRSDGTSAGTVQVQDINPGTIGSDPSQLLATSAGLFFVANDGTHGNELWRSNGTSTGTTLVQDIYAGPADGVNTSLYDLPFSLTQSGERIFFQANDGIHGYELWSLRLADVPLPTATPSPSLQPAAPTATPSPSSQPAAPTATSSPSSQPTTPTPDGPAVVDRPRILLPLVRKT